jgi:hypothetical protein
MWLGTEALLKTISYRHSSPAFLGDTLQCGGNINAIDPEADSLDVELWARRLDKTVTTSGTATFAIPGRP